MLRYSNYNRNYNYITLRYTKLHKLQYTTLHYAPLHSTTLPYITLHYITFITPPKVQLQLHYLITLHHNYNSTTLQLQLQLHYTSLHPAVVGEVTDQVTTSSIVTTPKDITPTTFQSISGIGLPSVIHNNQPLL